MKKLILNLLIAVSLIPLVSSCGDDESGSSGSFTFDGEKYKVSKAFVTLDGFDTDGDDSWYYWTISLTSSGIKFDSEESDFIGNGNGIILEITAVNDDGILPTGTYKYVEESAYCEGVFINYSPALEDGGDGAESYELDDNEITITISKSGSTYTIKVSGNDLTATFKGKITLYEQDPI